jgi:hypothetical protein
MVETLLGMAEVRLYGEKISDMKFGDPIHAEPNGFVRVYGFGFEGKYHGLDIPTIMLLKGPGAELKGSELKKAMNVLSSDIKEWVCDKFDQTTRLDAVTGPIEKILLEFQLGEDDHHGGRVSGGRVSGGRVSGGRVSGGRVSGGRVSGAKSD